MAHSSIEKEYRIFANKNSMGCSDKEENIQISSKVNLDAINYLEANNNSKNDFSKRKRSQALTERVSSPKPPKSPRTVTKDKNHNIETNRRQNIEPNFSISPVISNSKSDLIIKKNDNENSNFHAAFYSPIKLNDISPMKDIYSPITDQKKKVRTDKKPKHLGMSGSTSSENYFDNIELIKRQTLESIKFVEDTIKDFDEAGSSDFKTENKLNKVKKENLILKEAIEFKSKNINEEKLQNRILNDRVNYLDDHCVVQENYIKELETSNLSLKDNKKNPNNFINNSPDQPTDQIDYKERCDVIAKDNRILYDNFRQFKENTNNKIHRLDNENKTLQDQLNNVMMNSKNLSAPIKVRKDSPDREKKASNLSQDKLREIKKCLENAEKEIKTMEMQNKILLDDVKYYKKSWIITTGDLEIKSQALDDLVKKTKDLERHKNTKENYNEGIAAGFSQIDNDEIKQQINYLEKELEARDREVEKINRANVGRDIELEGLRQQNSEQKKHLSFKDKRIEYSEKKIDAKQTETLKNEYQVQELEDKLNDQKDKWKKLEDRNKSLYSENRFLQHDLKEMKTKFDKHKKEIIDWNEKVNEYRTKHFEVQEKNKRIYKDLATKKKLQEESKDQNKSLITASNGLKEVIESLKLNKKDYESNLNNNVVRLESQVNSYTDKLKKIEKEHGDLKKEHKKMHAENEAQQQEIKQLKQNLKENGHHELATSQVIKQFVTTTTKEHGSDQKVREFDPRAKTPEKRAISDIPEKCSSSKLILKYNNESTTKKVKLRQKEVVDIKEQNDFQISESNISKVEMSRKEDTIKELQDKNKELNRKNIDLRTNLIEKNIIIKGFESSHEELPETTDYKREYCLLKNRWIEMEKNYKEILTQNSTLINENDCLQEDLAEKERYYKKYEDSFKNSLFEKDQKFKEFESQFQNTAVEKDELIKTNEESMQKLNRDQTEKVKELEITAKKVTLIQEILKEKDNEIEIANVFKKSMETNLKYYQDMIQVMEDEANNHNNEIENLKTEIETLTKNNESLSTKEVQLSTLNENQKNKVIEIEENVKKYNHMLEDRIVQYKVSLQDAKESITTYIEENEDLKKMIEDTDIMNKEGSEVLLNNINEKNMELVNIESNQDKILKQKETSQIEIKSLYLKNNELEDNINQLTENWNTQKEILNNNKIETQNLLNKHKSDNLELTKQIETYKTQSEEQAKIITELKKKTHNKTDIKVQTTKSVDKTRKSSDTIDNKISDNVAMIENLDKKLKELISENDELKKKVDELNEQLQQISHVSILDKTLHLENVELKETIQNLRKNNELQKVDLEKEKSNLKNAR